MYINLVNKQLKNDNFLRLIAGCLVFPAYIDFFISKSPVWQGLAYLTYTVPLAILFMNSRVHLNLRQIGFWLFFLSLWIVPSLINLNSGRLESDRIIIYALTAKLFFLTVIVIFAKSFFQHFKEGDFSQLMVYILAAYLPMILMIFFESIDLSIACHFCRIEPFNNLPFFVSELFYVFIFMCLYIKKILLKLVLIVLSFFGLIMLEGRAAMLSSLFLLMISLGGPIFVKNINKKSTYLILIIFLIVFIWISTFLIENTFFGRSLDTLTWRIHMYELSINSIIEHPLIGIGFGVSPNYYTFVNHHTASLLSVNFNEIHNFFLRIATENGLPILILLTGIFITTFIKMLKAKMYFELAFFVSFFIYNSLSTRHLSLNLMNVLFYIIIVKVLMNKKSLQNRPA